jgi:transposase-like protein
MPRCTICYHPERDAIEQALLMGESFRAVAVHFGTSATALFRHRQGHLAVALVKAQEATEMVHGDTLLEQVRALQTKTLTILARAEAAGQLTVALQAVREARGCLELLAKLLGELNQGPTVNVLVTPEWQRLRAALITALAPFPEARAAVLQALTGAPHALGG